MTRFFPLLYGWGPLVTDELARLRYSEKLALESPGASADAGGAVHGATATMSLRGMGRTFSVEMPGETTLATTPQRSRGKVLPFSLHFREWYFADLYEYLTPHDGNAEVTTSIRLVNALQEAKWQEAFSIAYGGRAGGWERTKTGARLLHEFAQIASGIAVFLFRPETAKAMIELSGAERQKIDSGNLDRLNVIAAERRLCLGWATAVYTALYRRPGSDAVREELAHGNIEPLRELTWGIIPGWRASHEFTGLHEPLLNGMKQGSAPRGPKPAALVRPKESGATSAPQTPGSATGLGSADPARAQSSDVVPPATLDSVERRSSKATPSKFGKEEYL